MKEQPNTNTTDFERGKELENEPVCNPTTVKNALEFKPYKASGKEQVKQFDHIEQACCSIPGLNHHWNQLIDGEAFLSPKCLYRVLVYQPSEVNSNTTTFETGAVRSSGVKGDKGKFPARFDLITPIGLRAVAEAYGEGAQKYGDRNWEKGFPESTLINHTLAHINNYLERGYDPEAEDDLGHAAWNLLTLIHFHKTGRKDLMDLTGKKNDTTRA